MKIDFFLVILWSISDVGDGHEIKWTFRLASSCSSRRFDSEFIGFRAIGTFWPTSQKRSRQRRKRRKRLQRRKRRQRRKRNVQMCWRPVHFRLFSPFFRMANKQEGNHCFRLRPSSGNAIGSDRTRDHLQGPGLSMNQVSLLIKQFPRDPNQLANFFFLLLHRSNVTRKTSKINYKFN